MSVSNGEIVNLLKVDSTNTEAKRILKKRKISSPTWIVAEEQTSGKGRGENKWVSNKGNLFASLIFPVSFNIKNLPILSCAVSLATYECVKYFTKDDCFMKIILSITLVFLFSFSSAWALPECEGSPYKGDDISKTKHWDNCEGIITRSNG